MHETKPRIAESPNVGPSAHNQKVAFGEFRENLSAKFVHDDHGWRFESWEFVEAGQAHEVRPEEPSVEDRAARFTTFDEALTYFRARFGTESQRTAR